MIRFHNKVIFPLFFLIMSHGVCSQELKNPEDYAKFLFNEKYFSEAKDQYLYLLYNSKTRSEKNYFKYWIARTELETGNFREAEKKLEGLATEENKIPNEIIDFQYLRSLYFQKNFLKTIRRAYYSDYFAKSIDIRSLTGWSYINLSRWEEAERLFTALSAAPDLNENQSAHYKELNRMLKNRPDFSQKSPFLAGLLSALFPGSGHGYAGNWSNALGAFLVNGIFGSLTYFSVKKQEWGYAAFFGFFEMGWYAGNIISAVHDAQIYNLGMENRFREQISVHFLFPLQGGEIK